MLLITELTEDVQYIEEAKEDGKKKLYIEGIFMQYDTPNKNGRIYSRSIMENEVNRYIKEVIGNKRAYGELNHPSGPQINLDRVSHLIETLRMESGGKVYGKACIVDTPMGNIAKGLLEGGARLGVSTRGLGSLKEGKNGIMEVQNDFRLVTAADIVADPSAPSAFVNGIMENVQWYYDERHGSWLAEKCSTAKNEIRKMSKRKIQEEKLRFFKNFLKTL